MNEQSINFAIREFICYKNIVRARKVAQTTDPVRIAFSIFIYRGNKIYIYMKKKGKNVSNPYIYIS